MVSLLLQFQVYRTEIEEYQSSFNEIVKKRISQVKLMLLFLKSSFIYYFFAFYIRSTFLVIKEFLNV